MGNPLYNDNKLKLGVFGFNCSNGCAATTAEGHLEMTWPNAVDIAEQADLGGFEALVPIARWRGFGGATNFNGTCFETYTWAAGLAGVTQQAAVFSTSHVPTVHPIVAAKQATTIDHISNGRFALNVVCGWFDTEFRMFGAPVMEHDALYDYAAEWLEIMFKLWTYEEEFDYEGRYFKVEKGYHQPKPIQKPYPAIMNAGSSETGARFAAKYADMVFTNLGRAGDEASAKIADLRRVGREDFGREFQVWSSCSIVCRPTQKEAEDWARYYIIEKGDWEAAKALRVNPNPPAPGERLRSPGWGGYLIIGTPERIVDELTTLSALDVDGVVLSWVNYQEELRDWNREVMPLLIQAGLRSH
ncbi:MAG TPA: LLM class flavin-dependent oxidoreductase [Chloroflexota bacterium]|nr:LLM class flavin-dependent oxidoreductase [Chloroflexota bacterium]